MDLNPASVNFNHLGRTKRRPELDALRGLFLVWMTLTHLPTNLSDFVNQPLGYISSAEGFVFLSAMLVAQISIRKALEDPRAVKAKLWKRALHLYGYHLFMLALVFTAGAAFAVTTHRPAIFNLLSFYLAHPATAIAGSALLIYCPPLLDILPMYIVFLAFSPWILGLAARKGWNRILAASGAVWLLAQFGLRTWAHQFIVQVTHLQIPLQETGAFNFFAWQAIWIAAMWLGAKLAMGENPLSRVPKPFIAASFPICLFFLGVRHSWLGVHLTPDSLGLSLDKWQLGPLRMINLCAFACVVYSLRKRASRFLTIQPFIVLGKASLEVFCTHLIFVFFGLGLLYGEMSELRGTSAFALVTVTYAGLILVAVRRRDRERLETKSLAGVPG